MTNEEFVKIAKNYPFCNNESSNAFGCYYPLALSSKNSTFCDLIKLNSANSLKWSCYEGLALNTGNVTLCKKLQGNNLWNLFGLLSKSRQTKCINQVKRGVRLQLG